jgi:serine/threonine protein kinase
MIKNPHKKVVYYHPLNEYTESSIIIKQQNIFHPNDWSLSNFLIGKYIGNGKYGKVYLVKEKKSKLILALKSLSKQKILEEEILNQIRR